MTRSTASIIVKIIGEPFLLRVKEYRAGVDAARTQWREFGRSIGADKVIIPHGFVWLSAGRVPSGWTRVGSGKGRFWRPRKGTPEAQTLSALPREPNVNNVFEDAIKYNIKITHKGETRVEAVEGFWRGPTIGWIGEDVYFARIPHIGRFAATYKLIEPDCEIDEALVNWTIPDGLQELSEAEMDLMFAQARVDEERRAREEKEKVDGQSLTDGN